MTLTSADVSLSVEKVSPILLMPGMQEIIIKRITCTDVACLRVVYGSEIGNSISRNSVPVP